MSAPPALVVLAKAPRPGEVKTRLCPPLEPDEAAELQAQLLDDVLATSAAAAGRLGLAPVLALHPPSACAGFARRAPRAFRVVRQRGAGLAERMASALAEGFAAGHAAVILRGSDSPLVGEPELAAALGGLERADLVVAPDLDGGYHLIGLRRPAPRLFDHPMSTASVLDDTLRCAREAGLRAERLAPGFDLDTAADLRLLARERERAERLCPRLLAYLDARGLWQRAGAG